MIRRLANGISSSSSLPHRLASSCASTSNPASQCRPSISSSSSGGKGRLRMRGGSISARIVATKQAREQDQSSSNRSIAQSTPVLRQGRGRTSKRLSRGSRPFISAESATAADALHLSLTPSHMPLPIPLGTEQYFSQQGERYHPVPTPSQWTNSALGPFDTNITNATILHGDVDAMVQANGKSFDSFQTTLSDHLHVMFALARPSRIHHLATGTTSEMGSTDSFISGDFFDANSPIGASRLGSAVNEAGARNALAAEQEWNDVLAKLGQARDDDAAEVTVSSAERGAVDAAVSDLNDLLGQLELDEARAMAGGRQKVGTARMMCVVDGEDGEEQWIRMDSTRRKRKKKINKHKFKKRRKAQRALRKKLGK